MIHFDLTTDRWFKFSFSEQMANIGADIDRAIRWRNKDDIKSSQLAIYRALELLDLTIADPKNNKGKRRELCRLREFLKDYFLCDNEYKILDDAFLYKYFIEFTYAAALEKGK